MTESLNQGKHRFVDSAVTFGGYAMILLIAAYFAITSRVFLSYDNVMNILLQSSVLGIVSMGMTVILIGGGVHVIKGGIDLSLANNLATAACLPVIAIPTTAGTGSEISQYAVLTNAKTQRKDSISSEFLYPRWALVDPEVTFGLPAGLTVSTGLDVLSHAIESITSTIENPLTDLLAAEAISLVFAWLPRCNSTDDHEARNHMSYASSLAGLAMSHCCGTLPHAMGCPLSGHCGVPHGLAVGVLQKATLQLISAKSNDKLTFIAEYLDPNWRSSTATAADYICARIDTLFASLGRDPRLSEFHISNEQIEQMIPDALAHGCASLTPVKTDAEMIRKIYQSIV